jgi:hypothetical protein
MIVMFECINGFFILLCDDDGFTVENDDFEIKEGSKWTIPDDQFRLIGGDIRLEGLDGWIEISKETLENNFRRTNHE